MVEVSLALLVRQPGAERVNLLAKHLTVQSLSPFIKASRLWCERCRCSCLREGGHERRSAAGRAAAADWVEDGPNGPTRSGHEKAERCSQHEEHHDGEQAREGVEQRVVPDEVDSGGI